MFDRSKPKKFRDVIMTEQAAKMVNGDEYAFLYVHKWLYPESLSWKVVGASKEITFNTACTMMCNYPKQISSSEKVM